MAFMEWDDSLSVGERALDVQHQRLIDIVNDMYESVQSCQTIEEEGTLTGKFLGELQEYSEVHFAAEEEILAGHQYPALAAHQEQHHGFIRELQSLRRSYDAGEAALSFDVFSFARKWIIHHIKDSDRRYIQYLTA